ncbi:TetR/AcrR family transcriptional regulator [Roseiconus nitratireducens]|uniref:TetR/AcrR family transcriptional regulator n=1 Tax=Roseiconus nitratireducens TaxID=2605748 RepID=A0A5M6D8U6_9BACT|nr:TetR/AcrR family transcriptional regulator [Roseiconus nitratireducens]KAA5543046.1 TetR/AcrR family transcriptional regulator [Roseiconus nitratireducens]
MPPSPSVPGPERRPQRRPRVRSEARPGTLSQRKRAAILAGAVEAFAECGFEHANMDLIAENAGVSKRTVYNHFESKDQLFFAVVEEVKRRSRSIGTLVFRRDEKLASQLQEFGRRVVDFHCDPPTRRLGRVILSRILERPQIASELFGESKLFEEELRGWIQAATDGEMLCCSDVHLAARQFLGLLETFVIWPQLIRGEPEPGPRQRGQIVAQCVEMFLARYAP